MIDVKMWKDDSGMNYDQLAETVFYPIYDFIAEEIVKHTKITTGEMIDVGCGGGHLGFALMKQCPSIHGTFADISSEALSYAEARAQQLHLDSRSVMIEDDVHNMDIPDDYADLIISRGSMIFWEDQKQAFKEIWRVLAPGGKTYIGTGMGSAALRDEINAKMEHRREGNWSQRLREKSKALSTEDYHTFFKEMNWAHEIIDNPEQGRWIILKK